MGNCSASVEIALLDIVNVCASLRHGFLQLVLWFGTRIWCGNRLGDQILVNLIFFGRKQLKTF